MFDIGATELLVIAIVAILVIGPKDMPIALRTAGRWIAKVRRVSTHFRSGLDAMVREAEIEEMDKKWRERNEEIMAKHPPGEEMGPLPDAAPNEAQSPEPDASLSAAEAKAAHAAQGADAADAAANGPVSATAQAPAKPSAKPPAQSPVTPSESGG